MPDYKHRIRVKFDNVDYARVLYFPRQIDLYVEALEAFCNHELGVHFKHMLDVERIALPTVHLEVDYRLPLQYEEEADIAVRVLALGEKSITFGYEVCRVSDGATTSRAKQIVAVVNFDTWQSMPIPARYREMLSPRVAGPR